jgi:predicted cation transporter
MELSLKVLYLLTAMCTIAEMAQALNTAWLVCESQTGGCLLLAKGEMCLLVRRELYIVAVTDWPMPIPGQGRDVLAGAQRATIYCWLRLGVSLLIAPLSQLFVLLVVSLLEIQTLGAEM